jgi:hypothetical protein
VEVVQLTSNTDIQYDVTRTQTFHFSCTTKNRRKALLLPSLRAQVSKMSTCANPQILITKTEMINFSFTDTTKLIERFEKLKLYKYKNDALKNVQN